jgi:hypothetical protein
MNISFNEGSVPGKAWGGFNNLFPPDKGCLASLGRVFLMNELAVTVVASMAILGVGSTHAVWRDKWGCGISLLSPV